MGFWIALRICKALFPSETITIVETVTVDLLALQARLTDSLPYPNAIVAIRNLRGDADRQLDEIFQSVYRG